MGRGLHWFIQLLWWMLRHTDTGFESDLWWDRLEDPQIFALDLPHEPALLGLCNSVMTQFLPSHCYYSPAHTLSSLSLPLCDLSTRPWADLLSCWWDPAW